MPVNVVYGGTVGECNVALAAAIGFINPLAAQIDLMIALGLGPLEFDLAVQFDAALALQASLSIQMANPMLAIELAMQALASLQAALTAALNLPMPEISAELGASASLAGALSAKLGGLKLMISAALGVKIPAVAWAAEFAAALGLGPFIIQTFEAATLATAGSDISGVYGSGLTYEPGGGKPPIVLAADEGPVYGIIMTTKFEAAMQAMAGIIAGV